MGDTHSFAMEYVAQGWSVIPIRPGTKKPALKSWEQYQTTIPTGEELEEWFLDNNHDIAIVTGAVSGIVVVDIDTADGVGEFKKLNLSPLTPTVQTRKGYHAYYRHPGGVVSNNVRGIPGCDLRGDGGYVVAPPSSNGGGSKYKWLRSYTTEINTIPDEYFEQLDKPSSVGTGEKKTISLSFEQGGRDDSLFHVALCLQSKRFMNHANTQKVLETLAGACNPPYPKGDISTKIMSASKHSSDRSLKSDIQEWILEQSGEWSVELLDRELGILSNQKANRRTIISRLSKKGMIEKVGKRTGWWRKVEHELIPIDFKEDPKEKPYNLDWPMGFGMEDLFFLYPRNICIIAGSPDSGKTAFLLNMIYLNQTKYPVVYYSSEMSGLELRARLQGFDQDLSDWKFKAFERIHNFHDVIPPDGHIVVIDYLEVLDDFYKVGQMIQKIHERLSTSIAFIAIQKKKGADLGRGAEFALERPRLYLSMDPGRMQVQKAKNWTSGANPNGIKWTYDIVNGCRFQNITEEIQDGS